MQQQEKILTIACYARKKNFFSIFKLWNDNNYTVLLQKWSMMAGLLAFIKNCSLGDKAIASVKGSNKILNRYEFEILPKKKKKKEMITSLIKTKNRFQED